jgi:hypothetical protein
MKESLLYPALPNCNVLFDAPPAPVVTETSTLAVTSVSDNDQSQEQL